MNWEHYLDWYSMIQSRKERPQLRLEASPKVKIEVPKIYAEELNNLHLNYNSRAKLDLADVRPRGVLITVQG